MDLVLTIIALQQGLFAVAWWTAGRWLGLSRRAAYHWAAATMGSALAIGLILQRGRWPEVLSVVLANMLVIASFTAMRRGVQIFLRQRLTDREAVLLVVGVLLALALFVFDRDQARLTVTATSSLIAWTLLRCAWESRRALRTRGDSVAARVFAVPLALLGGLYALRVVVGLWRPDIVARAVNEDNAFNAGVVIVYLVVGLVVNMALAYLVINRLVRRLHHLSIRDPLTGLLNRRGLAPRLTRQTARLLRHGECFAVLAVDIDHFKKVNDRHGHATGDAVLVHLGSMLHEVAREADAVARMGGEEFCLLLPHCDVDGARSAAERLCRVVREAPWPQLQQPLTVSVGVALAERHEVSAQTVMARADRALMQAKGQGRDQVVIAGP